MNEEKSFSNSHINWYPGHMAKTRRQIKENIDIEAEKEIIKSENMKRNAGWGLKKMSDADFNKLEASKWQFKTADDLVKAAKTKYFVDQVLEAKIRSLYD